jgi:hypothetical protein
MILDRFRPPRLPFDMFDRTYSDDEARRARRMENIYHAGQERMWDGRGVLADLVAKHGHPHLDPHTQRALARVFSIIMWGELAAWKVSAQLADRIEPLEPKLAAASQVHDEARHFYVMHDYLELLGERPKAMDPLARRVLDLTLGTDSLVKKLLGMQLVVESIALVIFQRVRELDVEPVLTELLTYFERDEARHVGLGIQMLPRLLAKVRIPELLSLVVFELDLLTSAVIALKRIEPDLLSLGVDPRSVLGIAFRKHAELTARIRAEFPEWPEYEPAMRVAEGICELLFPSEGKDARVPLRERLAHAVGVVRGVRPSVMERWGRA